MRILILTLLFFTLLPASAENNLEVMPVKKIEANPINVAVMLTEQLDSASAAATCEYYGYVNQPSQGDFTVFKHPNGSIIRFNFTTADNGKKYPTVEVKSKEAQKDMDKNLKSLNFNNIGSLLERNSIGFTTQCASTSQGFLQLKSIPKAK